MATNPTLLSMPLAQNGQKNVIPATQATAGDGLFSQSTGFPAETSLPLGAGGVAPSREDFNGAFNLISGVAFYAQKGWIFRWDATQDYYAGCVVRDTNDGNLYECINDVSAGGGNPAADSTNWQPFTTGGGGLYLRQNSTAYAVGDIAYNANLPSYMHLLCTTAGTTDSTEPDFTGAAIGGTISDGTVVWTYSTNYDVERDFTYIYPNGGTEANPATVSYNTRYVESNPFAGYIVACEAEVLYNGVWEKTGWFTWVGNNNDDLSRGFSASQQDNDKIIVVCGTSPFFERGLGSGGTLTAEVSVSSITGTRIKVWKIGKAAS